MRSLVLAAVLAAVLLPCAAEGQSIGQRIRDKAKQRIDSTRKAVDTSLVATSGKVVDSAASKSERGATAVVSKSGSVLGTAIDRTERGVSGLLRGRDGESLAEQVTKGHVTLADVAWNADGTLAPASMERVRALAPLLVASPDTWIITAHAQADSARADRQAKVVKGALLEAGMDPSRMFARGAAAGADGGSDAIEIVRMQ